MSHTARVRLTMTMEYPSGAWGDDCSLGQLRKQAKDEADGKIEKLIAAARGVGMDIVSVGIDHTMAIIVQERA